MKDKLLREARPLVEGEDFYREGAAIVFTAAYHLRRGYCCGSGCRHCPYDKEETGADACEEQVLEKHVD